MTATLDRVRLSVDMIPTDDRFPEPVKPVLLSIKGWGRCVAGYSTGKEWRYANGLPVEGIVTHWSDLPAAVEP